MKWNNNFNMKKNVNGKNITVGMQNFDDMTILVKEETGKMETRFHCPYADTYTGYEDEMCRNCCGLGVDE